MRLPVRSRLQPSRAQPIGPRRGAPTLWLGGRRGYLTDWVTQLWVRLTGRRVDLEDHRWLLGPTGSTRSIGPGWFRSLADDLGAELGVNRPGSGLVARFADLAGTGFDPGRVHPEVVRFYERTSEYTLELEPTWQAPFRPLARLLMVAFAHRLQQLNLPMSSRDTVGGIRSDIVDLVERDTGRVLVTGWLRHLVATGDVLFAACYSVVTIADRSEPVVKVLFPLPNGNASVFLRPAALADGSLELTSRGLAFGSDGFYLVVRGHGSSAWVRRVALSETICVRPEGGRMLSTRHEMRLWGRRFLVLDYRMRRKGAAGEAGPEGTDGVDDDRIADYR